LTFSKLEFLVHSISKFNEKLDLEKTLRSIAEKGAELISKRWRVFGMSKHERSLLIPNPALPVEQMKNNIEEFNRLFGFRTEMLEGNLDMLSRTWKTVKDYLCEGAKG
jgi:hypothetical protein